MGARCPFPRSSDQVRVTSCAGAVPGRCPRLPYRVRRNGWRRDPARARSVRFRRRGARGGHRRGPRPGRRVRRRLRHGAPSTDVDGLLALDLHAVYVVRAAVRPRRRGGSAAGRRGRGAAVRREAAGASTWTTAEASGRGSTRAGVLTRVGHHWRCAEPVAPRPGAAGRAARRGWSPRAWWDKVPPVAWWPTGRGPAARSSSRPSTCWTWLRVLVGEVDEVHARCRGAACPADRRRDAATVALLRFAGGAVGTLSAASRARLEAPRRASRSSRTGWSSGSARTGWRCTTAAASRSARVRPVDGLRRRRPGVRRRAARAVRRRPGPLAARPRRGAAHPPAGHAPSPGRPRVWRPSRRA